MIDCLGAFRKDAERTSLSFAFGSGFACTLGSMCRCDASVSQLCFLFQTARALFQSMLAAIQYQLSVVHVSLCAYTRMFLQQNGRSTVCTHANLCAITKSCSKSSPPPHWYARVGCLEDRTQLFSSRTLLLILPDCRKGIQVLKNQNRT